MSARCAQITELRHRVNQLIRFWLSHTSAAKFSRQRVIDNRLFQLFHPYCARKAMRSISRSCFSKQKEKDEITRNSRDNSEFRVTTSLVNNRRSSRGTSVQISSLLNYYFLDDSSIFFFFKSNGVNISVESFFEYCKDVTYNTKNEFYLSKLTARCYGATCRRLRDGRGSETLDGNFECEGTV